MRKNLGFLLAFVLVGGLLLSSSLEAQSGIGKRAKKVDYYDSEGNYEYSDCLVCDENAKCRVVSCNTPPPE